MFVNDDLAQAVAVLDVPDHGQAGRWNEEDLTPGFRSVLAKLTRSLLFLRDVHRLMANRRG